MKRLKFKKKKIIIFTTSRADFYLLSLLIKKISNHKKLNLKLVATGNHFEKKKGDTYKEILKKKIKINYKVRYKEENGSKIELIHQISKAFKSNFKILNKSKPDLILLLGDRYELIPIAYTSLLLNIPIAHLQGGEVTEGAFDDSIRHSLTKLSNLHFACNEIYRKRIIKMGENPKYVIDVGGIGAELISNQKFLSKKELEKKLNINLNKKIILVCLHPETKRRFVNYSTLFKALDKLGEKYLIILTSPNSDPGSIRIQSQINNFKKKNNFFYFSNLGSINYHSILRISEFLIGNSSSGLLEAPLLHIPTINLGNRQSGRLLEDSVYNCKFDEKEILKTIVRVIKRKKIKTKIKFHKNKKASDKIINKILRVNLDEIKIKKFYEV